MISASERAKAEIIAEQADMLVRHENLKAAEEANTKKVTDALLQSCVRSAVTRLTLRVSEEMASQASQRVAG